MDDVPELEDLEDEIKKVSLANKPSNAGTGKAADYTVPVLRYVEDEAQRQQMLKEVEKEVQKVEEKVKAKEESFGGFKKGFFGGGPPKPKQPSTQIQEVKKPEKKQNPLQIKQVQEAMKVNDYLGKTRNEWMTNDFLSDVSSNEKIGKLFTNPEYMQAIDMFQKRPKEAMQKYGKNKQFMESFQEFCRMMGGQFTKLAQKDKEGQPK